MGINHGYDHDDFVVKVLYFFCGSQSMKSTTAPKYCWFEGFCPVAIPYFKVEGTEYVIIDSH